MKKKTRKSSSFETARDVSPAAYPIRNLCCPGGGGGYPVLVLATGREGGGYPVLGPYWGTPPSSGKDLGPETREASRGHGVPPPSPSPSWTEKKKPENITFPRTSYADGKNYKKKIPELKLQMTSVFQPQMI